MVAGVPIWGWIVAGIILLGMGLWWLFKAEDARYSELEFWLNDGMFGRRALMGREAAVVYPSLDAENKAYVELNYAPKKLTVSGKWSVLIRPMSRLVRVSWPHTLPDLSLRWHTLSRARFNVFRWFLQ